MTTSFTLPLWYDLHTHLRQDALLGPVIRSQLDMGCAGVLAMPNTRPPVAKIAKTDDLPYWSLQEYRAMIKAAGGDAFDAFITPLYLTKDTDAAMIEAGVKTGWLKAVKYYPPHGTTGADFGVPLLDLLATDIFKAMQDHGVTLCVHGEEHHMRGEDYFARAGNAEEFFYRERLPRVLDRYPDLRVVGEHVTTKVAVDVIKQAGPLVMGTITPQHLLYTIGHLLQGLKYHLYCLPLLKFEDDRDALRGAVTSADNQKFFAGTDSAPHTQKATECGCAAGCFTGGIAPQLYAEGFEQAGLDLSNVTAQNVFQKFLCDIGRAYYDLPVPERSFTLTKAPQRVHKTATPDGDLIPLPLGMGSHEISWNLSCGA